jgi:hypothetical protein
MADAAAPQGQTCFIRGAEPLEDVWDSGAMEYQFRRFQRETRQGPALRGAAPLVRSRDAASASERAFLPADLIAADSANFLSAFPVKEHKFPHEPLDISKG